MGITNFPNGVGSFGIPLIGSGPILTTGTVRFVHAGTGSNDNTGQDPDRPLATIDAAVNLSTASSATYAGSDYIICLPGHAETLSAAAGADLDVAGVTVMGLGRGSLRPTITLGTAATADFDVGADGTAIINLLFVAGIDGLNAVIDVDATTGFLLEACEFRDAASIGIDDTVDIANETDVTIQHCRFYETDTGVGQSCILGTTPTRPKIVNNRFLKDAQTGVIELGNAVDLDVVSNYIETLAPEDLAIVVGATATGWIDDNWMRLADNAANVTEAITVTNDCQLGRNWVVNLDSERALEHNQTQTTDA